MTCKRYAKWINDAALGPLDAARGAKLRQHLLRCARCQGEIDRERRLLAAIDHAMASSRAVEPAARLHIQVRQKIAKGVAAKVGFSFPLRGMATVAAACAVIGAGVLVWQMQRPSTRRLKAPTVTVAREQPAPQLVLHETKTVAPPVNRARQEAVRHSKRRARLNRSGGNPPRRDAMPQVLVPKDEMALVLELYNGVRTGKIDGASLLATPPGFKREADGTLVPTPIEIKPIEISRLDSGQNGVKNRPDAL